MKSIFGQPSNEPGLWIIVVVGFFQMTIPFFFHLDNAGLLFTCLGLTFVLIGGAEAVPKNWRQLAVGMRIAALLILGLAILLAIRLVMSVPPPTSRISALPIGESVAGRKLIEY